MDFFKKCETANFAKILQEKGMAWFKNGPYDLNIIGVRSDQSNQVTNLFDDALVVVYMTNRAAKAANANWSKNVYPITTEPGTYYMTKKLLNKKGTAILVPGQYRGAYTIGKHNGKYTALVQIGNVKVYRDGNKNMEYDLEPQTIQEGTFGINIHRSNEFHESTFVNNYSAGCQVFANPNHFDSFMRLCKRQREFFPKSTFTYTLLEEKDLIYFLK